MTAEEMPKAYDPREAESRWYDFWENSGFFTANRESRDAGKGTYVIAIPPPNVTGSLHMGHACRVTFEDVLIRHKRMQGYDTLWIPGTDHAGIATQVVVERQLKQENISRHDLGREKFIERVWKWKGESGGRILMQLRKLGASADWTRERFTMDEGLSRAVREVFVRLYEEGLIYRATRLVNWDVETRTVLSDLEVETEENVQGELFEFAYAVEGGGEVVVATTRPETMLGDTGIAVHPEDPRYAHLHGKFVTHPFVNRRIAIITDAELVDPKFGTGVVKVTPAHDFNDFQTGKRHKLEEIMVIGFDGKMNENAGEFAGLDRFKARKAVKEALEQKGLVRGVKPHVMTLPRSQRSNTVVEPMISTQWFVKMEPLAKPAIEVVENGKIQIVPEEWTKTYFHFMRNIQDWCISRQLWWGHAIPAWYCGACEHVTVSRTDATKCEKCGSTDLKQDEDVLDTWFSSALWPFSTLGWPDKTPDLARYYPTTDMETGFDILFFWVARMIMMGMHFMDGEVPFKRVLLGGMVTDERGDKMSKVKGNVIDPLDVMYGASLESLIEKAQKSGAKPSGIEYIKKTYPEGFAAYGADSLRMTLLSYSPQTRKIALSIKRIEGYRNFGNKLWNAARYALGKIEGSDANGGGARPAATLLPNRWILSRLHAALEVAEKGLGEYRLDDASGALYHFVWDELCDWYLEITKPLLDSTDEAVKKETRDVLAHVLEATMRALHPMMPFLTEELWQRLPKIDGLSKTIVHTRYPEASVDGKADADSEEQMKLLTDVVTATRTIRAEHQLTPRQPITMFVVSDNATHSLVAHTATIATLCNATSLSWEKRGDFVMPPGAWIGETGAFSIFVPSDGLVDHGKERERLAREIAKIEKDLGVVSKKLSNASFLERAPAELVATERARITEMEAARARFQDALSKLPSA